MALVTLPNIITNGTTADADEVQQNDNALRDGVNNVESANIVDGTIVAADFNDSVNPVIRFPETGGRNFVVDGATWITITTSGDLNYTVPAFTSYVNGVRLTNAGFTQAYTPSRDTYIDQDDLGALTFQEVLNSGTPPAQTPGTLRLLKIVSDVSTITDVVTLAKGSALDTQFLGERRKVDANIVYNTGSAEVPGNQEATLIFRGRDSTGNFLLDTGTAGVTLDTSIKQLVNGMDQNIVLTAATPIHVYCIGAEDDSVAVGGLLSYETGAYGTGTPILPVGYDIFKWVGTLMTSPAPTLLLPSSQSEDTTIFHESIKNAFASGNNGNWNLYTFDPLFAVKDNVGAILIKGIVRGSEQLGYANQAVVGSTAPEGQVGAVTLATSRDTGGGHSHTTIASDGDWVPLDELGKANIYHEGVIAGTGTGQQEGRTMPFGAGIFGWKYKHN